MTRLAARILAALSLCLPVYAAPDAFRLENPALLGAGNAWIAVDDGAEAPFRNPAFFGKDRPGLLFARLATGLDPDGFRLLGDLGSRIRSELPNEDLTALSPTLLAGLSRLDGGYRGAGPLYFAYRDHGIGLGLFSLGEGRLRYTGATLPEGDFDLHFDMAALIGSGFEILRTPDGAGRLHAGISLKYVVRTRFVERAASLQRAPDLVDPFDLSADFAIGQAIGSDIGLAYEDGPLTIGLVLRDWFGMRFSWTGYDSRFVRLAENPPDRKIGASLGLGLAWDFPRIPGIDGTLIDRLRLAGDLRGFFEEEHSFFNMIHCGVEARFFELLQVRLGLSGGHPSLGLGIRLLEELAIDYAWFASEGGGMPGQSPISWHLLSFSYGL